jgi:uncharacterized coiled-coil protein SlyX
MGRDRKAKKPSVSSVDSNSDKLDEILHCLDSLDDIKAKLSTLETTLATTREENKKLNETVLAQDKNILDLQDRLNNLEQHGRSFSIRVSNLDLSNVDEKDPPMVIKKVHDTVFLPIFKGAASKGAISQVPSCYEAIEMAHPLPGRGDKPKPIIVRFFNRNIKALLFKHRKEFPTKTTADGARPKYSHPFHDDLTRDTFLKLKQMQADPRIQSCWSTGGSLRYKLVDSEIVKRVPSVYLSNDEILK